MVKNDGLYSHFEGGWQAPGESHPHSQPFTHISRKAIINIYYYYK